MSIDVAAIDAAIPPDDGRPPKAFRLPERIGAGDRHATLFRLLRSQKGRGLSFDAAVASCVIVNQQQCDPPLPDDKCEWRRWWDNPDAIASASVPTAVPLRGFDVAGLILHAFPERTPRLYRGDMAVFRAGDIGQIYAERGIGKTWLLHTLAFVAAFGVEALGFRNPDPCRVLIVDGEMSSQELQERTAFLCRIFNISSDSHPERLMVVGADWQESFLPRIDTPEGQKSIEPFVEAADLVMLDNRSCLFDSEGEKDPTAWQPAQDYLLSLRRRGKAVQLGHHSNRQGGARGLSKAEDPMNLLVKLTRPEDYSQEQGARFLVTFDKTRGFYGQAAAPFIAHLTPEGWAVETAENDTENETVRRKILDFLRNMDALNERPKTSNAVITGARVGRTTGLTELKAMVSEGVVTKHANGEYTAVRTQEDLLSD